MGARQRYHSLARAPGGAKPNNIMVKDFNIFVNRRIIEMNDPILDRALSVVKDDDWKRLRSVVCYQSFFSKIL